MRTTGQRLRHGDLAAGGMWVPEPDGRSRDRFRASRRNDHPADGNAPSIRVWRRRRPPAGCSFVPSPACQQPGGTLGGEKECSDSTLSLNLQGTGTLAGWNRTVQLPVSFETHVGPRTPGQPVQQFATDMFHLEGELPPGDPDFDVLTITGGTNHGMPSPGLTKLTQQGRQLGGR